MTPTPSIEEIEQRLKQVLLQRTTVPLKADEITSEVALIGEGLGLDSVALLEFIVGLEDEFGIMLDDSTLTTAHFESLKTLARHVQTEIEAQPVD